MSPYLRFSRALLVVAAPALLASLVSAQASGGSNVTCTYADWEENSLGQTACFVWGQLQSLCITGGLTVTPLLNASYQYSPPAMSGEINECNCNVVSYNLMAACSWCQPNILTNNWVTEADWQTGCTTYDATGLAFTPNGVDIPAWAYLADNGAAWDPDTASAFAASASTAAPTSTSLPTSAGTPTPTSQSAATQTGFLPSSSGSSSGASQTPGPTATGTAAPNNGGNGGSTTSSSSTNVGAIAGGVVGGVAALVIAGVLIWFCLRRSRRQGADPYKGNGSSAGGLSPAPMAFAGGPGSTTAYDSSTAYSGGSPPPRGATAQPWQPPPGSPPSTAYTQSPAPGYGGWTPQPYGAQTGGYGQPNPASYVQQGPQGPHQGMSSPGEYRGLPEA